MKINWKWFNGKKTTLGLVILAASQAAIQYELFDEGTMAFTILTAIGGVLTAWGIGHKMIKK